MPIWFDYREKALLRLASSTGPAKEISPSVGDIWIGDMSGTDLLAGGVILERKTGADLEASILDGRYSEQRGRLLAYANQHKVAIGYVIEGILDRFDGRLSESALLKHITRLQFHHRIPVIQTASLQETLRIATLIEEQWVKDKGQFSWQSEIGSTATPVAASYVKATCRDSPEAFMLGVLTQCRGVSEAIARSILEKYPRLSDLLTVSVVDLAAVAVGEKRKVGKAVAERLHGLLHYVVPLPQM
jgi:ERCC4-type nuclease